MVVDADRLATGPTPGCPAWPPRPLVLDHGKIYLSEHLLSVCARLGISIQPARPYTPTDKAAVERFFRTLGEQLLAALPGYKGPDVYSRGDDVEEPAPTSSSTSWSRSSGSGSPPSTTDAHTTVWSTRPCRACTTARSRCSSRASPGPGACGYRPGPTWSTTSCPSCGGRSSTTASRSTGCATTATPSAPYRNRTQPLPRAPTPASGRSATTPTTSPRLFFQDPADHSWHTPALGARPGRARALQRRGPGLRPAASPPDATASPTIAGRWPSCSSAGRSGLTSNPTERRMALRLSQQRAARTEQPSETPGGRAPPAWPRSRPWSATIRRADRPGLPLGGDDDDEDELLAAAPDERDAGTDDAEFYADAMRTLSMDTIVSEEQDYTLSLKEGWCRAVEAPPRTQPADAERPRPGGPERARTGRATRSGARSGMPTSARS